MPTDRPPLKDLELPPLFDENRSPALPIEGGAALPNPQGLVSIPLPIRPIPPRVVIADDDISVIEGLRRSLEAHYLGALDVRFWQPGREPCLKDQVLLWMDDGWRPDVVVIDINMDDGGRHGVHYLEKLRKAPRCAALAVVLTTGNQYRDLDAGQLTLGKKNVTKVTPDEWLKQAWRQEPDAILYGKTADAQFLGRIGEHLPEWQRAAHRRAWVKLLGEVSQHLDGAALKMEVVANMIVNYAVQELEIDDAFVRWRQSDDQYELVAAKTTRNESYVEKRASIDPRNIPILNEILNNQREPVIREALSESESGIFAGHIAGHRFLGAGMVLGDRPIGFITLLRHPDKDPFDEALDGRYLAVLARLLASALGRDTMMRDRQTRLLEFANTVAKDVEEETVCQELAKMLHQELHGNDNSQAKTTARLLDFGKGLLERHAHEGMPSRKEDIAITDTKSIYAERVRENKPIRIDDVCKKEYAQRYKDLCKIGGVKSELCVPLPIGDCAIGAVNLEHLAADYYQHSDEEFVQAAAGLAASAVERIHTTKILDGMADFVHRFAREETTALDYRLRELLYEFCGYSVLVDLVPKTDGPWSVRHVECRFTGANPNELRQELESKYAQQWGLTWVSKLYRNQDWKRDWAQFTKNDSEFLPVELTREDGHVFNQKADALLWLRRGNNPPHRALLLMWYLPPPMNKRGEELLGRLARLFSELDGRQQHIRELVEQNLIGEQAAQIGHVMQHFRHRLGNLTGSLVTHIDRVEKANDKGNKERFRQAVGDLRASARDIANSFNKSRGYVKKPEMAVTPLQEIITKATGAKELAERLQQVDLQIAIPDDLLVWSDVDIASLVLYSLLENALDAIEQQEERSITLRATTQDNQVTLQVIDNGPGIPEDFRNKLFEWGQTTKSDGLGSALAFARTRMRILGGKLLFPAPQPATGALFEIHFPIRDPGGNSQ